VLLSRFWYVVLSAALAAAMFFLYLATAVSNRNARKTAARLLTAASQSVSLYMRDDARGRAAALIPLSFDPAVRSGLAKANKKENLKDLDDKIRSGAKKALSSYRETLAQNSGMKFDALWAIDRHGRVLASDNFERGTGSDHFEMGGYSIVADALHGWIRDDAWVFDGHIYRVVGRPVEVEVGGAPVGAIIGAKVVDDSYAQAISDRTGAAVAFYAGATRVASGAPPSFDKAALEVNSTDIEKVEADENYKDKGRTSAMLLHDNAGYDTTAIFARLPGDAWDLGAGYLVGHRQATVGDPFEFQRFASDEDKSSVPLILLIFAAAGAALLGLIFSLLEHTLPLHRFKRAVQELGDKKSSTEVLQPSTFRGVYKKIAASVNDAMDKVALKAGVDRGPADMESVLGPLPAQPQMSAFAVPKSTPRPSDVEAAPRSQPEPPSSVRSAPRRTLPKRESSDDEPQSDDFNKAISSAASQSAGSGDDEANDGPPETEEEQWRRVYQEFISLKRQLGENTKKLTYDKFKGTLQRNKDALMKRHKCEQVKFRVYEKQGRAALKASPVK
jgi:hypothetical protein